MSDVTQESLMRTIQQARDDAVMASPGGMTADEVRRAGERISTLMNENARLRACLERWRHDGRLQSYEDRERFRAEAGALLLPNAKHEAAPE